MQSSDIDPAALGFTVIALNIALEEALKSLAEKNGNRAGPWFDEVQELALLRANWGQIRSWSAWSARQNVAS